jgi:hypothetical protein
MDAKKLTKRTLLGILIVLSGIVIVFIVNTLQQYKKLDQGDCITPNRPDTIPFTYSSSGHIIIQVKLNGDNKLYPFILDCGAANFIFSDRINELNLSKNGFGIGAGANGNIFITRIRHIDSLGIGKIKFRSVNAKEVKFNPNCFDEIYGLIGTGIMHHLDWQIDFEKKIIVMADSIVKSQIKEPNFVIPLSKNQFSNHLSTLVKFGKNKEPHSLFIDTGNSGMAFMDEKDIINDSLHTRFVNVFGKSTSGLGNIKKKDRNEKIYLVDSVYLGESDFPVFDMPINASPKASNLLGLGFFKHYKTTISWKRKELILEPYTAQQQFIWETYGFKMEFDEQTGKTTICSIIENTPADQADIPLNAEVISINNFRFINEASLCNYRLTGGLDESIDLIVIKDSVKTTYQLKKALIFE